MRLKEHGAQVRSHLTKLSSKAYWSELPHAPEFVVMFLPGEAIFGAAVEDTPTLLEEGVGRRVLLATPTTFIALLQTVHYGWRQERLAENAEQVSEQGRILHERVATLLEHWARLGTALNRATEHFNAAAASLESRVLPSARRLEELGATGKKPLPDLPRAGFAPAAAHGGRRRSALRAEWRLVRRRDDRLRPDQPRAGGPAGGRARSLRGGHRPGARGEPAQRLDRHRQPQGADGRGQPGPARTPPHDETRIDALPLGAGGVRGAQGPGGRDPAAARRPAVPAVPGGAGPPPAPAGASGAGSFEMRLCPRVHFKAVIVDGARIYLGSANWTGAGLGAKGEGRRNFELGFVSSDDLLLDEVQDLYDRILERREMPRLPAPRGLSRAPRRA